MIVNGYTTLETLKDNIQNIDQGAITAFADNEDSGTTVTSWGHSLGNKGGDQVFISGTTSYNGPSVILNVVRGVSFDIPIAFVSDDATGEYTSTVEFDNQLELVINAVSRQIDQSRKTRFYSVNETRDFYSRNTRVLYPNDLLSITEIKIDNKLNGTFATTLVATDYITFPANHTLDNAPIRQIQISPQSLLCFPSPVPNPVALRSSAYRNGSGYNNGYGYNGSINQIPLSSFKFQTANQSGNLQNTVRITGDFGYSATTPAAVESVCILACIKVWRRRDAIFGVVGGGQLQKVVMGVFDEDIELKNLLNTIPKKSSILSN